MRITLRLRIFVHVLPSAVQVSFFVARLLLMSILGSRFVSMYVYACDSCVQYMQHGSLRHVLSSSSGHMWLSFSPDMRAQIVKDVAAGMAFLHAKNLYHRDLKR